MVSNHPNHTPESEEAGTRPQAAQRCVNALNPQPGRPLGPARRGSHPGPARLHLSPWEEESMAKNPRPPEPCARYPKPGTLFPSSPKPASRACSPRVYTPRTNRGSRGDCGENGVSSQDRFGGPCAAMFWARIPRLLRILREPGLPGPYKGLVKVEE